MVTFEVLGQQDQVVTALVGLPLLVVERAAGDVDLAADDGLEGHFPAEFFQLLFAAGDFGLGVVGGLGTVAQGGDAGLACGGLLLEFPFDLLDVVVELLDSEHIAVVGYGNAGLAVGNGLVDEFGDAGLTVENRVLRMYVKVYELGHFAGNLAM